MVSVYVNPKNDGFIVIGRLAGNIKIHKVAPYHDSLVVLLWHLILISISKPKSNKIEDEHSLISTSLGFMHFYFHVSPSVSALTRDGQVEEAKDPLAHLKSTHHPYLIFVIFLHMQNFWRIKFTPKNANFSR